MEEQVLYEWSCQRFGKWYTTSFHCTEEQIRKEHPEAIPIVSSMVIRMVSSTPEEMRRLMVENSTSGPSRA